MIKTLAEINKKKDSLNQSQNLVILKDCFSLGTPESRTLGQD